MRADCFGNPVTAARAETVEAIDRFTTSLLRYGTDFAPIFAAAEAEPNCALANAYAALLGLWMENRAGLALAERHLVRAIAAAPKASEREQWIVDSVAAARDKAIGRAVGIAERLAADYPGDLFSAKVGQTHYFNVGDNAGMLRLADKVIERHRDCAWAHGMRAFGLEQCHRLDEAEEAGRRATEMLRREPWAHHAVAHVMETRGRLDDGIAWMRALADTWEDCNSFMYTHNWWHLALFHLDRGEVAETLRLYDERLWGREKSYSQDQVGAISMLWRLEMRGVDVGGRWRDVADYVAARELVHDEPFLDVQYLYALARAGEDAAADAFLEGLAAHAAAADPYLRPAWVEVALPLARAVLAQARGRDAEAVDDFAMAIPALAKIGGSHAQRDLFEQARVVCLERAGLHREALAIRRRRAEFRPAVASGWRLLRDTARAAGDVAAVGESEAALERLAAG
ncbi:tetratricopeptide repeat protein [Oceanibacterium hippocampi]|uniref:Tetratricopeptide repeat protein 38 n=1 Tax=Oceanibacterium hippocampi TaxID=745714 RepID=A0A1Y5RD30_9PROT|nr:tetratricopeptide repeat protein [Oceanibacterium hippocampi]SLN12127.1 hypothetical protein OCH7691_00130 [Oceanibacterium hippocampi]